MKLASILLWVVVALSPQAMEALSQITGTEILSGQMDLHEGLNADIQAIGKKAGVLWEIGCTWKNGRPGDIGFSYFAVGL